MDYPAPPQELQGCGQLFPLPPPPKRSQSLTCWHLWALLLCWSFMGSWAGRMGKPSPVSWLPNCLLLQFSSTERQSLTLPSPKRPNWTNRVSLAHGPAAGMEPAPRTCLQKEWKVGGWLHPKERKATVEEEALAAAVLFHSFLSHSSPSSKSRALLAHRDSSLLPMCAILGAFSLAPKAHNSGEFNSESGLNQASQPSCIRWE